MASKWELTAFAVMAIGISYLGTRNHSNDSDSGKRRGPQRRSKEEEEEYEAYMDEHTVNEIQIDGVQERRISGLTMDTNMMHFQPRSVVSSVIHENEVSTYAGTFDGDDDDEGSFLKESLSQAEEVASKLSNSQFSTAKWVWNYIRHSGYFSSNRHLQVDAPMDSSNRPINILCMDGGGAKGLSLKVIYEALETHLGSELRDEFDLVAGTSIGGIAALFTNQFPGVGEVPKHADFFGKMITAGSLRAPRILQMLRTGYVFNDNRDEILKYMLGKDTQIKNDREPKAFVVGTTRESGELQPYLMRTYEAPVEQEGGVEVVQGTCRIKAWEAAVATSAAPVAFDRVKVEVEDDNKVKLADGGLVANDPTELALYEAVALFPDHPIGLVLSLGCGRATEPGEDGDDTACCPEIEDRVRAVGGEYFRFNPVIGNFSSAESNQEVLNEMEGKLTKYMQESPHANILKHLLAKHADLRQEWEEVKEVESRPCGSVLFHRSIAVPKRGSTDFSDISNLPSHAGSSTAGGSSHRRLSQPSPASGYSDRKKASPADGHHERRAAPRVSTTTTTSEHSTVPDLPDPTLFHRPSVSRPASIPSGSSAKPRKSGSWSGSSNRKGSGSLGSAASRIRRSGSSSSGNGLKLPSVPPKRTSSDMTSAGDLDIFAEFPPKPSPAVRTISDTTTASNTSTVTTASDTTGITTIVEDQEPPEEDSPTRRGRRPKGNRNAPGAVGKDSTDGTGREEFVRQ